MDLDMEFTNNTLYVFMKGNANRKGIFSLRKKMYRILDDYDIQDVVINIHGLHSMDGDTFYQFLDDYDNRYGGNLNVID